MRRDVPGKVYLLHLDPPYKHARHYLGFAEGDGLDARLAEHGGAHGARLLAAQKAAGGTWHLVRTWDGTRGLERQIKNTRHVPHYCPNCQPGRTAQRREAKENKMAAEQQLDQEHWASARAGADDAGRLTARLLDAGMTPDRISAVQHETAARLLSEAQTSAGRAHAVAFDDTSRSLLADLRDDAGRAQREPEAASLPDGTAHPDKFLAARGWQTDRGVYVRREAQAAPVADREAC